MVEKCMDAKHQCSTDVANKLELNALDKDFFLRKSQ